MNVYRYSHGRISDIGDAALKADSFGRTSTGIDVVFHPLKPLAAHLALSSCVAVWELGRSVPHATLSCGKSHNNQKPLTCLSSSPQFVIAGRSDGWIFLWEWQGASLPVMARRAHSSCVLVLTSVFTTDRGECVYSISCDTIAKHNLTTGVASDEIKIFDQAPIAADFLCAAASPTLLVVSRGKDIVTAQEGFIGRHVTESAVLCVASCSKMSRFVAGCENGSILLGKTDLTSVQLHRLRISGVACTTSRIISCSVDCSVWITTWEGLVVGQLAPAQTTPVCCIAVNERYGFFVTGMVDNAVKVWRPEGTLLSSYRGCMGKLVSVTSHALGGMFACVGDDLAMRAWALPVTTGLKVREDAAVSQLDGLRAFQTYFVGSPSDSKSPRMQEQSSSQISSIPADLERYDEVESSSGSQRLLFLGTHHHASDKHSTEFSSLEPTLIDVETERIEPSVARGSSRDGSVLVQAICRSSISYSKFSEGIVLHVTTESKNLQANLEQKIAMLNIQQDQFSLDKFLRGADFSDWAACSVHGARDVTPADLQLAVSSCKNCPGLILSTIPSPLQIGIRNFLLIFACHPSSPVISQQMQLQSVGMLLMVLHEEVMMRLPRFSGNFVFRWCRATVSTPSPGTEIVFPCIPFCTTSVELVDAALRSEHDVLSGTIVVIHTSDGARRAEVLEESLLSQILFEGDTVVFSPFQRFRVGNSEVAYQNFRQAAATASVPQAVFDNLSFWTLYEVAG